MNRKTIKKILAATAYIILLPLIAIEILIKNPAHFTQQIRLGFQVLLFIVDLGSHKIAGDKKGL
ncbi:MAG: hypothetical protein HUU48_07345 [Flavobacteriales bacterium]|nr:hypothetical protein [Flavobacteriales bacterium]